MDDDSTPIKLKLGERASADETKLELERVRALLDYIQEQAAKLRQIVIKELPDGKSKSITEKVEQLDQIASELQNDVVKLEVKN